MKKSKHQKEIDKISKAADKVFDRKTISKTPMNNGAFENLKRLNKKFREALASERQAKKDWENAKADVVYCEAKWFSSSDSVSKTLRALHEAAENMPP